MKMTIEFAQNLFKFLRDKEEELSGTITGGIDSMENYRYALGYIHAIRDMQEQIKDKIKNFNKLIDGDDDDEDSEK